jgi:cytochrome P450
MDDDLHLDMTDPAFLADPYPTYRRLREKAPVHKSALGFWAVTRYDDVAAVLRDPRLGKEAVQKLVEKRTGSPSADFSMLTRDPPDHTRLRGLVAKAFTPRVAEAQRQDIERLVNGLIDRVEGAGKMDLMEDFAYPLPIAVICDMLGIPVESRETFKTWNLDIARGLDSIFLVPEVAQRAAAGREALSGYFRELIAERRKAPQNDLLSVLIAAEEAGDKLSEHELIATCNLLLLAGHETTVNLIGNGTLALLRHPAEMRRLRENPSLGASAIEELLRYDSPVQRTARMASEDVSINGQTIPKGEVVTLFMGAANRDPARFSDPDRLDIGRPDNRHLSFSHGIHFCLGAPLARAEGQIAIATLARRLPKLALATESPEFRPSVTLRGLEALPVTF